MSLLGRSCCGVVNILNYNSSSVTRYIKNKLYQSYILPAAWKSTNKNNIKNNEDKVNADAHQNHISFDDMVEMRRCEARRSILVQVHSEQSCNSLYEFCSKYGDIKGMHHYTLPGSLHFVLVEFCHKPDVDHILEVSSHVNKDVIPVRSPFLWFRAPKKSLQAKKNTSGLSNHVKTEENFIPSSEQLRNILQDAESLSDQILILHRATSLSDLGSRLRFLTAHQIELALYGLFPQMKALPFGSSVNGFGKAACDLDLVLVTYNGFTDEERDYRLMFHAKTSLANERMQVQRHMETLGDVCQLLLPGCSHVRRILQARVPIIKYHQDLTGMECDLSMSNMSAIYMSELLYILGASDWRVRPLVFAVRGWAREIGLTNPTPGRWITNFSITLLVIFYLQQKTATRTPVLPTLNTLVSLSGSRDKRVTSDGTNCTFLRDISCLHKHMALSPNTDSLEELFMGFFEFYSSFDFFARGISLNNGTNIPKPEHSSLYIANPLERGLNVSKNVSQEETERLKIEIRNAAWILESVLPKPVSSLKKDKVQLWGLTALFESSQISAKGRNIFYIPPQKLGAHRMMDVSELFAEKNVMSDDSTSSSDIHETVDNLEGTKRDFSKRTKVKATSRSRRR